MATIGTALTLADWAKRTDPDGRIAKVAELLAQQNEIINHAAFQQGNLPTGHRYTVRTGLPSVYWRLLNKGVAPSKSTTAQATDSCGILEARGQVDVDIASLENDLAAFRLSEATPFLEAMTQEFVSTLFYGVASDPEEFIGLSARYSDSTAANGQNIIKAGGAGSDNASIWLVVWGPETVFGIFPKGSSAGIVHEDLGVGDAFDANNNRFRAYLDRWQIKGAVSVKDWRFAVRIPNIDVSNLVAESSAANITKLMTKAWHRIPSWGMGRAAWYMNRTCAEMLDIQRMNVVAGNGTVAGTTATFENVDGVNRLSFRGIPIYVTDALTEAESLVA